MSFRPRLCHKRIDMRSRGYSVTLNCTQSPLINSFGTINANRLNQHRSISCYAETATIKKLSKKLLSMNNNKVALCPLLILYFGSLFDPLHTVSVSIYFWTS